MVTLPNKESPFVTLHIQYHKDFTVHQKCHYFLNSTVEREQISIYKCRMHLLKTASTNAALSGWMSPFAKQQCMGQQKTRRPASADRTAHAANFRRDLKAT